MFEDLDAQVTEQNRSFFLNRLDGFEPNAGLLVIATTNHPERLDPAIVERPSRFDRKYHFARPAAFEREGFLARWIAGMNGPRRPTPDQLARLVAQTDGFSFACLKELCLAAALRWMKARPESGLHPLLEGQLGVLRAQMRSEGTKGTDPTGTDSGWRGRLGAAVKAVRAG